MDYGHLITIEPGKRSGQPCIRGMQITVQDVLEHLAGSRTAEEVLFAADRERRFAGVSLLFDQNLSRHLVAVLAAE